MSDRYSARYSDRYSRSQREGKGRHHTRRHHTTPHQKCFRGRLSIIRHLGDARSERQMMALRAGEFPC